MAVNIPATPNAIYLKTIDQLANRYETNVTKGFSTGVATYDYVNTACRSLASLLTNTYLDSIVEMSKSVNEALADGD